MHKTVKSHDGTAISYSVEKRSDRFMVFVHGMGGDLNVWKRISKPFNKSGFSTISIDLRGHGLSERPPTPSHYKLTCFARDIHAVLKKEKAKNFVLIGHCFGGAVVITFHRLFPNKAAAYVLISTAYRIPATLNRIGISLMHTALTPFIRKPASQTFMHRDFDRYRGTSDWNLNRILADITTTSLASWLSSLRAFSSFDGTESLATMNLPCLILVGKQDTIVSPKNSRKLHKMIKASTYKEISNSNHIIVISEPGTVQLEIENFLKSIRFLCTPALRAASK
ncbi:alpha/beta hydrolase [Candidatus Woesearchaeota archaeon]|nr:alpha/beta hydrolase [Candidatus Woesearchaeota archaeon]